MLALVCGGSATCGLFCSLPTTVTYEQALTTADTPIPRAALSLIIDPALITITQEGASAISATHETRSLPEPVIPVPKTPATTTKKVAVAISTPKTATAAIAVNVFAVPFFSQLTDITAASWKKVGCGITSLAMLIEYYTPGKIDSVDTLLHEGIAAGAYTDAAGWSYNGLITVAKKYGLSGDTHDYKNSSMDIAFAALVDDVEKGPVMASVHYTFKVTNPIPHLVIINGVKNGLVYYNDPAAKTGGQSISVAQFKEGWKKRYIEFYPEA